MVAGLRPERLKLAEAGRSTLDAVFDFAEDLGAQRIFHLRIEDLTLTVASPAKADLAEGETVGVEVSAGAVQLFDAGSGRLIAPEVSREFASA